MVLDHLSVGLYGENMTVLDHLNVYEEDHVNVSGADPGFEKGGAQVASGRVFGHI